MSKARRPIGSRTTNASVGFTHDVRESGDKDPDKISLRCTHMISDRAGHIHQCQKEFHKDRLPKDPNELRTRLLHKCYDQSMMDMLDFSPPRHLSRAILMESLIQCARNLNLAIEATLSQTMRQLVLTSIRIGQESPNVPPIALFPAASRSVFNEQFIT
jgi:hypothetical protein